MVSMSIATDYVLGLILKQVADHRLVVWYDSDGAYAEAVDELEQRTTANRSLTVAKYKNSFLQLRKELDHLLNGEEPPRLVVYVPVDQGETHHALIELETAGVVVQPGQQPPQRNTRLSIVARNALKTVLGEEIAHDVEKQVEAGKLTLADVNALAKKGSEISSGVVSLIFDTGSPQEVALAFLDSNQFDSELEQKSAQGELFGLLGTSFDIELPAKAILADVRDKLARHVLLTELIDGLGNSIPAPLESVQIASAPNGLDACVRLAKTWRQLRDYRDSYIAASTKVEQEFALGQLAFDPDKIIELETVLAVEKALLRHVEQTLLAAANKETLTLAQSRLSRFWSAAIPAIQAHWALIASIAEVLLEAGRVKQALKTPPAAVPTLIKTYTEGQSPWCLLDTYHRHMESRWYSFEPAMGEGYQSLEKLIHKARQQYTEVGSELAQHFVTQYHKAKHPITDVLRQLEVFEKQVQPKLEAGKTAYIWVDALRFEMARELCEVLKDDFDLSIEPAIGTIPTITQIGMAGLLPRANQSAKVVSAGSGKLGLEIQGKLIAERKDRIAFLKEHVDGPVFDTKLDSLLPKPSKKIRDGIEQAQLILVTSQEIDELCEMDNIPQARRQMDSILNDLRRSFRILSDLKVQTIILTADHGHIFADEISDDMKIDAPGGNTADLHRRVWIGVGGTVEPSYLRTSLASLGIDSEYDLATPWTFACFKSKGGARAYFHGGLSPQELIVPVVVMTSAAQAPGKSSVGIEWTIIPGTQKLTTRFFSVQVGGTETGLFAQEPPRVRVEIRARGKCISTPVSASYGFEDATGEVQLKQSEEDNKKIEPNTVTLMIVEDVTQKTVGLHLIDATSGAELASLDNIEVAISL